MTTNEIREKFLKFFASKGHTIVDSDSVVPKDDPTVLFTTAGMQQFKPQFLGQNLTYRRAATCQKCLRTDDLEKVGKTPVHHTFFEMLGNFSFGDYFKKEAIEWAWEFFTRELKLPADKLWVSVYKDDDEAYQIWLNNIKIPASRILKLGDKDNFWPAEAKEKGPNGPCGPCSEIFFDFGVNPNCPKGDKCNPECNCGRFAEIWNLVFTQFNRKEGGALEPLPAKNIDTGMGLERLAAVLQGKKNNFENDVFAAIISAIKKEIPKCSDVDAKIIADHVRAIVFGIADGVIPSNEGRGYVIKKLIINSSDLAIKAGEENAVIYKLVQTVVDTMGTAYQDIGPKSKNIIQTIKGVEEVFIKIRKEKIPELKSRIEQNPQQLGQLMFQYRDTYGLTLGTITETASSISIITKVQIEKGTKDYETLMDQQKERSRSSSKMTGDVFGDMNLSLNDVPKTEFLGYDEKNYKSTGKVIKIFKGAEALQKANKGDVVKIVLDRTPFYAEAGGQIGDTGTISSAHGKARVTDTQKTSDVYLHSAEIIEGSLSVGENVDLTIDSVRRLAIMRNHTATHLTQAALRKILGTHVQQQGSLVAEDRLRFDFTHPKPPTPEEKNAIEEFVNAHIATGDKVSTQVLPLEEAKKLGALAFFAEKYGKTVRVISIGDYSKEFCGGTHLNSTKQIESFKITSIGAVAQGIRRIEALTGVKAIEYARELELKNKEKDKEAAAARLLREQKKNKFESAKTEIDDIINKAETVNDSKVVTHEFADLEMNFLRELSDLIRQKSKSVAVVLGSKINENASLLVGISDDLVKKGLKANEVVQAVAPLMNGSGGGRPQMAQAGGKDPAGLTKALLEATKILKEKLKG